MALLSACFDPTSSAGYMRTSWDRLSILSGRQQYRERRVNSFFSRSTAGDVLSEGTYCRFDRCNSVWGDRLPGHTESHGFSGRRSFPRHARRGGRWLPLYETRFWRGSPLFGHDNRLAGGGPAGYSPCQLCVTCPTNKERHRDWDNVFCYVFPRTGAYIPLCRPDSHFDWSFRDGGHPRCTRC